MIVCIASYPRSGQVWLARLLARAVGGRVGTRLAADVGRDIAAERFGDREFEVHRTHATPDGMGEGPKPDRVVQIIRDPRAVLLSNTEYRFSGPEDGGLEEATQRMVRFGRWGDFLRAWFNQEGVLHVRYEDFWSDPEGALTGLLCDLGMRDELVPDQVVDAVWSEGAGHKREALDRGEPVPGWTDGGPGTSVGQAKRHLGPAIMNRWRDALPLATIGEVEERYAQIMWRCGYEPVRRWA